VDRTSYSTTVHQLAPFAAPLAFSKYQNPGHLQAKSRVMLHPCSFALMRPSH